MKKILLALVILFFSALGTATISGYSNNIEYGGSTTVTVEEVDGDSSADYVAASVCGQTTSFVGRSRSAISLPVDLDVTVPGPVRLPQSVPCGLGTHEVTVTGTDGGESFTAGTFDLTVEPKGRVSANKGAYLYVEMDVNRDKIRDFILTNDREPFYNSPGNDNIHGVDDIEQGDVLLAETDWRNFPDGDDDYGRYRPPPGEILSNEDVMLAGIGSTSEVFTNNHNLGDNLGAQDVWDQDFQNMEYVIGQDKGTCTAFENNFDSCTPAHDDSSTYSAYTEILKGNRLFHICRGSMDGEIVDTDNGQFRCDVLGNGQDWRGNEPNSWLPYEEKDCADPVVGLVSFGPGDPEKTALSDYNSGGVYTDVRTGCSYNNADVTIERGEPDIFLCEGYDAVENSYTGNDPVTTEKDTACLYNMRQRTYPGYGDPQRRCTGDEDCQLGTFHNTSAPETALAVKYYVPKEAIPLGNAEFKGTKFATSSGFNNVRFDHIHAAELRYLEGSTGDTYERPYTHNTSKYDELNISRGQAYTRAVDDTNETAIRQVWNPSNATGQYTGDIRETSEGINNIDVGVNTSDVFNGGFYPSCEPGLQWGYDEDSAEWRCTGALDTDVQFYAFETEQFYGETTTGFFVMPYLFRQSAVGLDLTGDDQGRVPYYLATQNADSRTPATLESLSTLCWVGEKDDKPSQFDAGTSTSWFAKEITGIGTDPRVPIPVFGNLTRNDGSDSINKYFCRFQFTNSEGQRVVAEGREVMVSREAMAEQTKAQSILQNTYQSYISSSWFEDQAVCNGNCQILMDKIDLEDEVPQSHIDELGQAWQSNLSYSFDTLTSSDDPGCYLKSGNRNC